MSISCLICTDDQRKTELIQTTIRKYCTPELLLQGVPTDTFLSSGADLHPQLIVLDLEESFDSVLQFTERVRACHPEAFLVVFVQFKEFSFSHRSMSLERVEFLPKPWRAEALQESIIGIVDRIFTRVGASDDLASGQSTFMVEMNEVANILRNATSSSLLILDEIGRGTSTFDGLAIAWAVVEHVANPKLLGAKTLFATHYHELTELEGKLPGVNNYCIAVKENGDDIVFLRKIVSGGADKSYGIQVAK